MTHENLLNESECSVVVENALNLGKADFEVISYIIIPVSSGTLGFLGEYFHLKVIIKRKKLLKSEELIFFVKASPTKDAGQKELVEKLDVFKREITLYETLFKELDKYNSKSY